MSVVYESKSSALAEGTTSLSVAYPAGIVAGDLLVLCITNKYPSNAPTIPSGWATPTDGQRSGGTGSGGDTGACYCTTAIKTADGTESGSLSVTLTGSNSACAIMLRYSVGEAEVVAVNAAQATSDFDWTLTLSGNPGIEAGDVLLAIASASARDSGITAENPVVAATGATFGTAVEHNNAGTNQGQDCYLYIVEFPVNTGPASAAPVYDFNWAPYPTFSKMGAVVLLRLRDVDAGVASPVGPCLPESQSEDLDNGGTVNWSLSGMTNNDDDAGPQVSLGPFEYSGYLKLSDFPCLDAIPDENQVDGIQIEIKHKCTNGYIYSLTANLRINGVGAGFQYFPPSGGDVFEVDSVGGATDTLGQSGLTGADIKTLELWIEAAAADYDNYTIDFARVTVWHSEDVGEETVEVSLVVPSAWAASLTASAAASVAWQASESAATIIPSAWLSAASQSTAAPLAWRQSISADMAAAVSWSTSLSVTRTAPAAWLATAAASGQTVASWTGSVSINAAFAVDWLATLAVAPVGAVAWRGSVAATFDACHSWQATVAAEGLLCVSWDGQAFAVAFAVPVSWGTVVASTGALPLGWASIVHMSGTTPVAIVADLGASSAAPLAWLGQPTVSSAVAVAWTGQLSRSVVAPVSWQMTVNRSAAVAVSWEGDVRIDAVAEIPVSWLATVVAEVRFPIGWRQLHYGAVWQFEERPHRWTFEDRNQVWRTVRRPHIWKFAEPRLG